MIIVTDVTCENTILNIKANCSGSFNADFEYDDIVSFDLTAFYRETNIWALSFAGRQAYITISKISEKTFTKVEYVFDALLERRPDEDIHHFKISHVHHQVVKSNMHHVSRF